MFIPIELSSSTVRPFSLPPFGSAEDCSQDAKQAQCCIVSIANLGVPYTKADNWIVSRVAEVQLTTAFRQLDV